MTFVTFKKTTLGLIHTINELRLHENTRNPEARQCEMGFKGTNGWGGRIRTFE